MTRLIALLGLAMTAAMVALALVPVPLVDRARDAVFDAYQRAAPRAYDPASPVHVIDIDEAALDAWGQWPWPRTTMAALTEALFAHGAVAVGFDVMFPEPDRTSPEQLAIDAARLGRDVPMPEAPGHDAQFAAAIAGWPVVLAVAGAAEGPLPAPKAGIAHTGRNPAPALTRYPGAVVNIPPLAEAAAGIGAISLGRTADGITRTVPMVTAFGPDGVLVPSLSAELLRVAQGAGGHVLRTTEASGEASGGTLAVIAMRTGGAEYPLEANGHFRLHFAGYRAERVTPAADLLAADGVDPALAARIGGKIVLVGSSAQGLFDIRTTPLDGQIAGVTIHAEVLEQVLAGQFLTRPDWMKGLEIVLIVAGGLVLTLAQLAQRPLLGLAVALALGGGAAAGGYLAFARAGLLFDPVLPALIAVFGYLPGTTLGFVAKERARRRIRAQFAHFLPDALIARIERNPDAALTPEGADRELSVMFVDMRGFTGVTEAMSPAQVVALVNTYLSRVSSALVGHGATIDKFMGDAVMAFWNAPIEMPDHAARALGAIGAVEAAVAEASAELQARGLPPVSVGIGLNTGHCSVGLMGSRDRLSYTCIGDSVTLAARLEGLTRLYGTTNCVGPDTVAHLPDGLRAVPLDLVAVKGRDAAIEVHLVAADDTPGLEALAEALAGLRAAYAAGDWDGAEATAEALAQVDCPACDTAQLARAYGERIAALRRAPPGPGWDGIYRADSKR
ncbi:MAG: adenylate cyclase [Rhodobacteraceae bacterium HLUCCA08]|nr:MAG: adenylate cyclase [Rhodobacteraceae bacterium HLUCCA08]